MLKSRLKPRIKTAIKAPAKAESLDSVHRAVDEFLTSAAAMLPGVLDQPWRNEFSIAVAEVAANIIRHAYPQGKKTGSFYMAICLDDTKAECVFVDEGIPYYKQPMMTGQDFKKIDTFLPEGGMGLLLVKKVADTVSYRRTKAGINYWIIQKLLKPPLESAISARPE